MSEVKVPDIFTIYQKLRKYASCEEIKAKLGGDANGLSMHQNE